MIKLLKAILLPNYYDKFLHQKYINLNQSVESINKFNEPSSWNRLDESCDDRLEERENKGIRNQDDALEKCGVESQFMLMKAIFFRVCSAVSENKNYQSLPCSEDVF